MVDKGSRGVWRGGMQEQVQNVQQECLKWDESVQEVTLLMKSGDL